MTLRRRRRPSIVPFTPELIGVALLVGHNYIVHRVLRPPADAALNLVSAWALTSFARSIGCTREELGLGREELGRGLKVGSIAAASCAAAVGTLAAIPATRGFFLDERLQEMSRRELMYHATIRIPVTTALAEEIMFRSVLHALFAASARRPRPSLGPRSCSVCGTCSRRSIRSRGTPSPS